jgi:hypothetical protein
MPINAKAYMDLFGSHTDKLFANDMELMAEPRIEMASTKNKMNAACHGFKHVLLDKRLAIHNCLGL